MLAGYTIVRILGQGGASVVYLARQEPFDREVAVKMLRRDVDEAKVWGRFLREARAVARLSGHPHVLTVHAAGRAKGGEPYLVTEYLDRGSLGDVIAAEGAQPVATVVRVGVAIADALAAAHGIGILHRDVKPGNVLLGHDGRIKLGDFGIARLLAGQSVTSTDSIAFTPEHVAPEILRGQVDGAWSDLYGLASTVAAALIGAPLFQRRPDERMESLLSRKLMAPPPPLPPSIPTVLTDLLRSGLDPEPSRRPTLSEFRQQLVSAADALGAELPRPLPPPAAAPAAVTVIDGDVVAVDYDTPDEPRLSGLGGRHRHGRQLAIAAFLIALLGAVLAVAVLRRGGDDRGDASSTTSAIAGGPVSAGATAPPSPQPTASSATSPPASSITSPPTTTATSSAPAIAPVTTASPPATVATTPATEQAGPITAEQAATFVRNYFDAVGAGSYQTSWSQLAPEFQRGTARSFDYYVGFWNDNDVEVGAVELVDAEPDRAVVNVELRWNDNSTAEVTQLTLRPDQNGNLLITSQSAVGG